jgi:polar amino acid transport system substrate-binding protein
MKRTGFLLCALVLSVFLAACGGDDAADEPAATSAAAPAASTEAPTTEAAPTTAANGLSPACAKESLPVKSAGKLTAATSDPSFPPYVIDNDPTTGQGFESAVAYAVAEQLGFTKDEVAWEKVAFEQAYAPGAKSFDFDINQVSITEDRKQAVSFSDPYYTTSQAILVMAESTYAGATALAGLQDAKLGSQIGTSSLEAANTVIAPSQEVQVYNDTSAATAALRNGQIDGIVVDLPTALFINAVELEFAGKVVGQFSAPGGDDWGLVSEKDSALTPCLNEALAALTASGKLEALTTEWMSTSAEAPVLQ